MYYVYRFSMQFGFVMSFAQCKTVVTTGRRTALGMLVGLNVHVTNA